MPAGWEEAGADQLHSWAEQEAHKRITERNMAWETEAQQQSQHRAEAQAAWEEMQMDMVAMKRQRENERRAGEYERLGRKRVGTLLTGHHVLESRDRVAQAVASIAAERMREKEKKEKTERYRAVADQVVLQELANKEGKKEKEYAEQVDLTEKQTNTQLREIERAKAAMAQKVDATAREWARKEAEKWMTGKAQEELSGAKKALRDQLRMDQMKSGAEMEQKAKRKERERAAVQYMDSSEAERVKRIKIEQRRTMKAQQARRVPPPAAADAGGGAEC